MSHQNLVKESFDSSSSNSRMNTDIVLHFIKYTVAILPTVVSKIECGLFYRRSTKLGSGYLLTVLIMDLMLHSKAYM